MTIITTAAPSTPRRAIRAPARRIMAAPNSIRSMTATRRSSTICGSRISAMTASTPARPTAAPGFPWACSDTPPPAGGSARSRRASSARRPIAVTGSPSTPMLRRSWPVASPKGRRRRAGAELPGVPPDHSACRTPPRGQRDRHRGDGMRQGHRRARRRAALPVLAISRWAIPPASRTMWNRRR